MAAFVGLAVLLGSLIGIASAGAAEFGYLRELQRLAADSDLHLQRYWHLLLHYRPTWSGGFESEADEPGFFLAPLGKTDPAAELQATLAQFFSTEPVGRSRQPARCAFIARYHWLKEALAIDETRLPPQSCDRFEAWLKELNPASITLIFPSAYMNNPSSMFGHLLLRVDQKNQTENNRLLAYTVNYSADVTTDNGILFAVLGVTGGFRGFFSTHPYYVKAREYGDFENRDIWEYRLNLSDDQLVRLLMHAWEMGNASFDYFFFKENCAYHILSLIDIADPEIRLTDRFWFYTFPSDGVRVIAARPGLVKEVTFRPSRATQVRRGREALTLAERAWLDRIAEDSAAAESPSFRALPPARQAAVLDVVSDYFLYKAAIAPDAAANYQQRNKSVLLARSQLRVPSSRKAVQPFSGPPEQGHDIMRAGFGLGWRESEPFTEINFRVAFHDLMDPEYGYTPDAQIEAFDIAARYYANRGHTRIERFTLVNIVSLVPVNRLFLNPSWKVGTGFDTVRHDGCRFCRVGNFSAGIGLAAESAWLRREVYFGFAELSAEYGRVFASDYRLGAGTTVGGLIDVNDRWKIGVSATYLNFPAGDRSDEWRFGVQQRYTLGRNLAARFEFKQRGRTQDFLVGLQAYF